MRQSKALTSSHSRRFRLYSSSMSTSAHFPSHCGGVANHPPKLSGFTRTFILLLNLRDTFPWGSAGGGVLKTAPPSPHLPPGGILQGQKPFFGQSHLGLTGGGQGGGWGMEEGCHRLPGPVEPLCSLILCPYTGGNRVEEVRSAKSK